MKRKRFIKLLMGRLGLTRNEAHYVADVTRVRLGKQFAGGGKTGGPNDADQH